MNKSLTLFWTAQWSDIKFVILIKVLLIVSSLYSKESQTSPKISWNKSGSIWQSAAQTFLIPTTRNCPSLPKISAGFSKLCSVIAVQHHKLTFGFSRNFWTNMVTGHDSYFYPHIFAISWFWQSINLKSCNFGQNNVRYFVYLVCTYTTIRNQILICCPYFVRVLPFLKKS